MSGLHLRIESASRIRLRLVGDERLVELVRDGDRAAFEAIYDRHAGPLLSFCVYMLGSHQDAEDAVQATFAAAHKALLKDDRELSLRPWLFVIARNACVSLIRKRRPWVELNGEPSLDGDPGRTLEVKEDVRNLVHGLLELPEPQRAALVLAEVQGLSQREISTVMGVRPTQVKAYAYQARANLIAERQAREASCTEIREELASAHGAGRLKSPLRRHLRSCDGCREYQRGLRHQSRALGALFPVVPSLALKARALQEALGNAAAPATTYTAYRGGAAVSGGAAGTAALAGGGFKAILAVVAGVACVGACGVGASLLGVTPDFATTSTGSSASPGVSQPADGTSTQLAQVSAARGSSAGSNNSSGSGAHARRTVRGARRAPGARSGGAPGVPGPEAEAEAEGEGEGGSPSAGPIVQGGSVEPAPAAASEGQTQTTSGPPPQTREQQKVSRERRSRSETHRTSSGEKRAQGQEERLRAREQRKHAREQEATEREERARSLHGLPPELRKSERDKLASERAERKAEKEKENSEKEKSG